MGEINFNKIEKKWQDRWEKAKCFEVKEDSKKKKYYVLEMFPYPSADGLHMGHALNYSIGDVLTRYKRMNGFNVLYPMGYDALGLPAENAAIKVGKHPQEYTDNSIKNFTRQFKSLGISYDWTRMVNTASPDYYKWDQWIFLKMLEKNLAYQKTAAVNWCPNCQTVLANEQVQTGKCWRHEDTDVEVKHLKQWFLKITDYANELYDCIDKLDWSERTKAMQKNWIGKSHGVEIDFEISRFGDISDKEFVFLHAYGDTSKDVFWGWLKKEIELRGGKIAYAPNLPGREKPKIEEQLKFVKENYTFKENTIVIAHSLGNTLMMKILERLKTKITGFVMVAPPFPKSADELKTGKGFKDSKPRPALAKYCDWKFDINKIKNNVDKILVLEDEKDHIVPRGDPERLANQLDAEYTLATGNKTHFNGEKEENVLNLIFKKWKIFTTRPDTIFGVTFMVVSAQHPRLMELVTDKQKKEVEIFLKKIKSVSQKSMKEVDELNKEGVFTGSCAINPATNEKVPVYAGNFVIADYGSGMVMAVPAHDARDFEFARKYKISVKEVVKGGNVRERAYTDSGILINSDKFNGLENEDAKEKVTAWLSAMKKARKVVNFRLRDWGISRQRYWGTPIPVIHCEKCGAVPVPEKDLPVKLPKDVKFGKGNPLETNEKWVNVKCPKCNGKARRETDTMDTFVNSSWYFLRYCDPKNDKVIFDSKKANYWCPIDQYIGGSEHACMHLIYFRFYTKFLADLGLINFREPAKKLFHQGMLAGEGGVKMSKSKGNVINPDEVSERYGIDTARYFLLSLASPDKPRDWNERGMESSGKFISKVYGYFSEFKSGKTSEGIESKINQAVKEVSEDISGFKYNMAIIKLRELFDRINEESFSKKDAEIVLKLFSPFCPHIAEELWEKIGNKGFISLEKWPIADESKINLKLEQEEKNVEKLCGDILNIVKIIKERENKEMKKAYIYTIPPELKMHKDNLELIGRKTNLNILVFAVNDKGKHDPENKAGKAKPGKPAIYLE